jgi:3-methylfumaryl-CoA hydratase
MSTGETIDIGHLQKWIGKLQSVDDDLHLGKVNAITAALDMTAAPGVGTALPLAWQWLYFVDLPLARDTGADGHPKTGGFLPPSPFPRRMWAAGSMRIHAPLRIATPAVKRSTISAIDFKQGRSGDLLFVTVDHVFSQWGKICIEEQQDLVYRPMPTEVQPLPSGKPAPVDADWRVPMSADPVLLFRYSALTANSHRIHYDRSYAQDVEHYAGLVVHGPLQATLLANLLAEKVPDLAVKNFSFRAQRPIFEGEMFTLCGRRVGDTIELWTETVDGFIGMWVDATVGARH